MVKKIKKIKKMLAERRYWKGYSKGYENGVKEMLEMIQRFGNPTTGGKK